MGGGLPAAGSPGPPQSPALTEPVTGCTVTLFIHDMSDNEQGFRVYRWSPGDPGGGTLAFELAASDASIISVQDTLAAGSLYTYTAESFNENGALGLSNPVTVDLVGAGCEPPESPPLIGLTPISLTPPPGVGVPGEGANGQGDDAADGGSVVDGAASFPFDTPQITLQAYCYVSNGGSIWTRYPAVEFLDVDASGRVEPNGQIPNLITLFEDAPVPAGTWDCWGWSAEILTQLGVFEFGGGSPRSGPIPLSDDVTLGNLNLLTVPLGVFDPEPIDLFQGGLDVALSIFDPVVVAPDMMAPRLYSSIDTLDCLFHAPDGSLEDGYSFCHPGHKQPKHLNPSLGEDFIPIEDHPHSYLYWDLTDPSNCPAGAGCVDPRDLTFFPHSVLESGVRVYDLHGSDTVPVATLPFSRDGYVVFRKGCGVTRAFEVRSYVKTSQPLTYESRSPYSFRSFQEPCGAGKDVKMELHFETIELGDVDDGLFAEPILEVYGSFAANTAEGEGGQLRNGNFIPSDPSCLTTEGGTVFDVPLKTTPDGVQGCPTPVGGGLHSLQTTKPFWAKKCIGSDHHYLNCQYPGVYYFSHSTVFIDTTQADDAILVSVDLWDHDHASPDDPVCQGSIWITKEAGEPWENYHGTNWSIHQGDNGSASCIVTGSLSVP